MNTYSYIQTTEYSIPKVILFCLSILVSILISLWVLWTIYFKIKHPFWSIQPVFHIHHIHKWFYPSHKIWDTFPDTKYVNKYNVSVCNIKTLLTNKKEDYIQLLNEYSEFIKSYYIVYNENTFYYPTSDTLHLYLNNNTNPSYIAYYQTPKVNTDMNTRNYTITQEKKSIIAYRNISLHTYENNITIQKELYYVDYLCTEVTSRKKGYTPQLIYTSAKEIANSNDTDINVFLFKREGIVHGIIPFIQYKSYIFYMRYWKKINLTIEPLQYTEITPENFSLFIHSIEKIKREMGNVFLSNITNLECLIEEKKIIPFILHHHSNIHGLYIFKNAEYTYKKQTTIEFISSWFDMKTNNYNTTLFFDVFLNILHDIRNQYHFSYIIIENMSYTQYIFKSIYSNYRHEYNYTSSYYLYNYIHPTISSKNIFMIF